MAWSRLQSNSGSSSGVSTFSVSYTSNLSAGTKLIAVTGCDSSGGVPTLSVKDSNNNSFTKITNTNNAGSSAFGETCSWAVDVPAADVGTTQTITVTYSGSVSPSMLIQEVSGLAAGNTVGAMIDGTAGTLTGSTAAANGPPTYTSTASNEYLLYGYGDNGPGSANTAPAGYTADPKNLSGLGNSDVGLAYTNSTGGTETGQWTTAGSWSLFLAAFKLASAAPGGAGAARPGRTWLRRFHHPQSALPSFAVAAIQAGPPVTPLAGPVRARLPRPFAKGRVTGASDGVFAQSGPAVTALDGPVRTRPQPPPRGRAQGRAGVFTAAAPPSGPPVYPLRGPVQARLPLQPLRSGRTATMVALPLFYSGPPVTPLRGPVRITPQPPPRGRAQGRTGTFTAAAPQAGPPVYPLRGPVRTRPQPPPRGRAASNGGIRQQTGPPVTPLRGPVCARQPLPRRGRCAGSQGTFTQVVIGAGPPVYPLRGPVRTRPQPPPRGRCAGSRGTRAQTGAPVTPLRGPVAPFRPGPYRKGRCASNPGTFAQPGPKFYPLRHPVTAVRPGPYRSGRCATTLLPPVATPPPPFLVARSTPTVTARDTSAAAVSDPRDGTNTVTAIATSAPGVT